jgi:hypothetical protein
LLRNASRETISLTILSAIAARWPSSFSVAKNSDEAFSGQLETSKIARSSPAGPTLTCLASRRRRVPPHSGHGLLFRYLASSSRTIMLSVSR